MRVAQAQMTIAEVRDLPPTIDLPTAGRLFGLGVNGSYEAYHRGEFPVRVLKLGRRLRVPTADVLACLGLDQNRR